jgi:CBS domain-containing protein
MRRRWIELSPATPILDAAQMMRLARVRHLPVVADGILLGLLSYKGLLTACAVQDPARPPPARVGDVMSFGSETAETDTPVQVAVSRMVRSALGCLPVVERTDRGPRLLGLLTESDLLRAAYEPWAVSTRG